MAVSNSFDVVSEVDMMEASNAVQQAMKEIRQRFDFKGSVSEITLDKETITLHSDDESRLKAVIDVLTTKLVKRGVSLKALEYGKIEPAAKGTVRQVATVRRGIPTERAKEIVKFIKGTGIRVQAQIQENQVRVSGKNRDDLQAVIGALKAQDFGLDLQFTNYRSS
ncbi:MAG: YajQ family cyclic di-GMP-binding protein [Candidatus Eisenbacteria bacterium]|uniref:Nucleotide-binding protein E6K76_07680 n=1 Tax=Eiseniibacteriota bacterium TaxID=2212470 RepID=A0A538T4N5_UNCEI|nr:MAG: YajQ family cyclic di-GMP-binding protein [Candidatus Eisenbacteria bacterium]